MAPSKKSSSNSNAPAAKSVICVGPAGWCYPDWFCYVYPSRRRKGFHDATYLAEFFDTIEINTSFYNPIRPDHSVQWIDRVAANPRFVFTAKLWQRFTHETIGKNPDPADSPGAASPAMVAATNQPIIGRSLEPGAESTSPIGYVRLHGRRYDTWFTDDPAVPSHERYNYLYSTEELAPWAKRVAKVAERSREVFVITNNHYQGKGVVNALQLISILKRSKVKVPEPLRVQYPELEAIADSPLAEPSLFPMKNSEQRIVGGE
ncbi:MAG TPA: DUF72 domain-containing protein [Candidatus Acidoferrum sp.]